MKRTNQREKISVVDGTSSNGQDDLKSIQSRSVALFRSKRLSDCSFRVGQPQNQQVFEAHKLILSMASPVFETMFYGPLAEKVYPIEVSDVEPALFAILMEFVYTDCIKIVTFNEATTLYYVAQKYMLSPVMDHCIMYLNKNLCFGNVCRCYEFACFYDKSDLKETCINMIKTEATSVLADPGFVETEISTLFDILQMDNLNIYSEVELFNALERHASGPRSADCAKYSDLVKSIRFLAMTPKEFADGPGCSKLLQTHEKLAILMNISSKDVKDCPMPEGFTISKSRSVKASIKKDEAFLEIVTPVQHIDPYSSSSDDYY